jgi:general secretion pathway protein F
MLFSYRAFSKDGKKVKGSLEAASFQEAKEKIRALDLIIIEIKEENKKCKVKTLKGANLVVFTQQFAQLVMAKIPLYEGLLALEEQARGEGYHGQILAIAERIKSGSSLSKALSDFPESFPPLYRALVAAGEAVGNLELALNRLATLLSYQQKMKKQLLSALSYPLFLIVLLVVAISILVGFVVPSMEGLFEGQKLPWFTNVVFSVSHILQHFWPLILLTVAMCSAFCFFQFKKESTKKKLQNFLLSLPFAGRYITLSCLSRFSRTLATLLEGGLPLPNAMAFAKEALHNAKFEEIFEAVSQKVIEGKTISAGMSEFPQIPTLFCRMVKIGEESGKLTAMLSQIAAIYEDDTERFMNRVLIFAQPILLIIMGVIIGTVILSILLPLSSFATTLSG